MSFRNARFAFIAFMLGTAAACGAFQRFSALSRVPELPVVIDGKIYDWRGKLYVIEDVPVAFGFLNDKENLYVCLLAEDAETRTQILRRGLTVWIDPRGGRAKTLGIKFPIGQTPGQRAPAGEKAEAGTGVAPEGRMNELEIIRSDERTSQRMSLDQARGIEVTAVPSASQLVYELKIPLLATGEGAIAVGAEPGKTIGVGFEMGKFQESPRPGGRGGGGGGMTGGMGGMGGRGRGGMGGGMGGYGRGPVLPEDLKLWAIVKLSES